MIQSTLPNSPLKQFKHCPKCGGDFSYRGGNHLKCQQCSYSYFVNQAPTAGILIFNDKNEVLLAKRKFEPKKGTWQSVGGFVELDEKLEDALIREAKEELGVNIATKQFLGSFPENYEFGGVSVPFLAMYFVADIVSGTPQVADDVAEVRYFAVEELADLDITYPELRTMLVAHMTNTNTAD